MRQLAGASVAPVPPRSARRSQLRLDHVLTTRWLLRTSAFCGLIDRLFPVRGAGEPVMVMAGHLILSRASARQGSNLGLLFTFSRVTLTSTLRSVQLTSLIQRGETITCLQATDCVCHEHILDAPVASSAKKSTTWPISHPWRGHGSRHLADAAQMRVVFRFLFLLHLAAETGLHLAPRAPFPPSPHRLAPNRSLCHSQPAVVTVDACNCCPIPACADRYRDCPPPAFWLRPRPAELLAVRRPHAVGEISTCLLESHGPVSTTT